MKRFVWSFAILIGCARSQPASAPRAEQTLAPRADHHTHLGSADDSAYVSRFGDGGPGHTAPDLIAALDSAHVQKALVLSTAYFFGADSAKVRAENDWVAAQIARYPDRLVGFCSVDPLREYALREIARCRTIGLRGLKLHLANSRVDFNNPDDVAKTRAVFAAADAERLPIVVHLRGLSATYGGHDARVFIQDILPAARDVPVQIAHLAGWGSYDWANDEALATFIDAMKSGAIDRSHIYFDISAVYEVVGPGGLYGPAGSQFTSLIAQRMREIGLDRVLFATDWPSAGSETQMAAFLVKQSGLTRDEVRQIFENVAPYLRER